MNKYELPSKAATLVMVWAGNIPSTQNFTVVMNYIPLLPHLDFPLGPLLVYADHEFNVCEVWRLKEQVFYFLEEIHNGEYSNAKCMYFHGISF